MILCFFLLLGDSGSAILIRVMGMILAVLAVEIILQGISCLGVSPSQHTSNRVSLMAPVQQSLNFFSKYGVTLSVLFVMANVAAEVVSINLANSFQLNAPWNDMVASFIGTGVFEPIASGAAIFFIASRDKGQFLSVYDCVMKALGMYSQLLICYMATTLLVLFGLSFYVIPGLFLLYKVIFAEYFIILNEDDPMQAIQHSFKRTEGNAALLFPAFCVILTLLLGCNILTEAVIASLGGSNSLRILGALVEAPLLAFILVVGYRLFSLTSDTPPKASV